jgi:hypothetical protein
MGPSAAAGVTSFMMSKAGIVIKLQATSMPMAAAISTGKPKGE